MSQSEPDGQPYPAVPPSAYGQAPTYATAPGYQQYGAPGPQYGAPAPQYGAPGPQPGVTPTIAVVGLVLAFVFWPAGLVLSIMSIRRTRPPAKGRGLAIAGIVVSAVAILATIGAVISVVFVARTLGAPAIAVTNLNTAFDTGDCDLYLASTTAEYQAGVAPDCAAFDEMVAGMESVFADYRTVVTNVRVDGGRATVTTTETYTDVATGESVSGVWDYMVVQQGGDWLVEVATTK